MALVQPNNAIYEVLHLKDSVRYIGLYQEHIMQITSLK
jgi:hypothetical protein